MIICILEKCKRFFENRKGKKSLSKISKKFSQIYAQTFFTWSKGKTTKSTELVTSYLLLNPLFNFGTKYQHKLLQNIALFSKKKNNCNLKHRFAIYIEQKFSQTKRILILLSSRCTIFLVEISWWVCFFLKLILSVLKAFHSNYYDV